MSRSVRFTRVTIIAALTLSVLWLTRAQAHAQQHQNGYVHQHWDFPSPAYNVDTLIEPGAVADATFFAQTLYFEHDTSCAGCDDLLYIGIQQGTGVASRSARFSLWNTTAARGGSCIPFDGEGEGMTCSLPYAFVEERVYNLRVWRLEHDGAGQWWGGWIIDTATGAETHIGDLRATSGTGELAHAISFDEYFGPAKPCDKVPYSFARFLPPTLEAGAATASAGATARGDCSGGSVTAEPDGSRTLKLGCNAGGASAGAIGLAMFVAMLPRRRRAARSA